MKFLRYLLFPFSILYGLLTWLRNIGYDLGIFKSHSFKIPIIAVGNLSTGGTGKSPQIEYLLRLFLDKKTATLSRGYKRTSTGFQLANEHSTAQILGDEPFQFHNKFRNIQVAVDANRVAGINRLLEEIPNLDLIFLDDAFQHRKVQAGLYILLTAYDDLFSKDWMLPTGNLREFTSGKKRAKIVVVTKCPADLSIQEQEKIAHSLLLLPHQSLFFSTIIYDDFALAEKQKIAVETLRSESKTLVAGIAKPTYFFDYLKNLNDVLLTFPDHHSFSAEDIANIQKQAKNQRIITTEKDYMRLKGLLPAEQLFYVPIRTKIIDKEAEFDALLKDYYEDNKVR
uniref:tetraacyldisaccharide 4'-kinase n=2 Tax=Flavobacterium sp. TaxID=239 RepID=UPI00404A6A24